MPSKRRNDSSPFYMKIAILQLVSNFSAQIIRFVDTILSKPSPKISEHIVEHPLGENDSGRDERETEGEGALKKIQ